MEQRAAIVPGLPCQNPTISDWQDPPSPLANCRTTSELPQNADIVVVGSGITGVSIAFHLLDENSTLSVVMLEARTAVSGATGRNGGHTKPAAYREFESNSSTLGVDEACKIVRLQYNCVQAVHEFARKHGIECDSWQGDTVDVFYSEAQMDKARRAVAAMRNAMGEEPATRYTFCGAEETERNFLAHGAFGAVTYAAGSIHPYKFVVGVLELALKKGLNLQTQTPALKVSPAKDGWLVETERGSVTAKKLVLATNGYTAHLLPAVQSVIVPLRGHMTAQRPGKSMAREGLASCSYIYDDGYEYCIRRQESSENRGDFMIGGGLTKAENQGLREYGTVDETSLNTAILNYLTQTLGTIFGTKWGEDHAFGRIRKAWTGIMGYSADGFPLIRETPGTSGLYIAASFQGSGMVSSFLCAQALVKMINGAPTDELDLWFPRAFCVIAARLKNKFKGRLHTTVSMEIESKSES